MKQCKSCKKILSISYFFKDKRMRDSHINYCIDCIYLYRKNLNKKKFPWQKTLRRIKDRINYVGNKGYHRYGGRGIKCLITEKELKELWFRDKAMNMKNPTIDRINNDGNYSFENCRYLEIGDNVRNR